MNPQRLGPYDLLSELGRGGMGVVYRAKHRDLRREVALKVPLERLEGERRERFLREAQLTAGLVHPGIVQVHEVGEADGRPFLAYELVHGARSIDEVWGPLAPEDRARLVIQAARALGYAHAQGIVHRDVKAENLLVDPAGRVRVTDFGVAHAEGLDRLTQTGQFVGTPSYASPEQLFGERGRVSPASDVWSLGVVLYQALAGVLPFPEQDGRMLAAQIMRSDPGAPHTVDRRVPPALSRVCLQALRKDPARRPPNGEAFAAQLEAALAGEGRARRAAPFVAALVACVALGSLAAGLAPSPAGDGDGPSRDRASSPVEASPPLGPRSPRSSGRDLSAAGLGITSPVRITLPESGQSVETGWWTTGRLWIADERRRVWLWALDGDPPSPRALAVWEVGEWQPLERGSALFPVDEDRAWVLGASGIWEVQVGESEPSRVLEGRFSTLASGPAAGDVVVAGVEAIWLLDTQGRLEPRPLEGFADEVDGRSVGFLSRLEGSSYLALIKQVSQPKGGLQRSESLFLIDLASGARTSVSALADAAAALAIDTEGQRCFFATYGGRITVISLETWQPLQHLQNADAPEPGPETGYLPEAHPFGVTALTVYGDRLYSSSGVRKKRTTTGEVKAWSLRGSRVDQVGETLRGPLAGYSSISVSPDGRWVALGTGDGQVELWRSEAWERP